MIELWTGHPMGKSCEMNVGLLWIEPLCLKTVLLLKKFIDKALKMLKPAKAWRVKQRNANSYRASRQVSEMISKLVLCDAWNPICPWYSKQIRKNKWVKWSSNGFHPRCMNSWFSFMSSWVFDKQTYAIVLGVYGTCYYLLLIIMGLLKDLWCKFWNTLPTEKKQQLSFLSIFHIITWMDICSTCKISWCSLAWHRPACVYIYTCGAFS